MATKTKRTNGEGQQANPTVSKYARFSEESAGEEVSWKDVNGPLLYRAIATATEDGCALIFSKTSDGGALSITLLAGANRYKKYAKSPELANSMLEEIIALHDL